MTPPRLNELSCPNYARASWEIDSDFRDEGGTALPYDQRIYSCRFCGVTGPSWTLLQQSPPAFLLQPHSLYPMTRADFDHWLAVLREHFPDHPRLRDYPTRFFAQPPPYQPPLRRRITEWLIKWVD